MNELYQITAPYFCAGIDFKGTDTVKIAAPIVKYMKGWTLEDVTTFCKRKKFMLQDVRSITNKNIGAGGTRTHTI